MKSKTGRLHRIVDTERLRTVLEMIREPKADMRSDGFGEKKATAPMAAREKV